MKKILFILILALTSSCADNEENCKENCYTIKLVENLNRDCSNLSSCNYTFKLLLENTCTKELSSYRTRFIKISQKPQQGSEICSLTGLIKQ